MAYDNSNGRSSRSNSGSGSRSNSGSRSSSSRSSSSSSRQYVNSGSSGTRQRVTPSQEAYHGPRGTQTRGNGSSSGRSRRSSRNGSGYELKSHNINFQNGRRGRNSSTRQYILIALGIVLVIILVVGISSCVRGCSNNSSNTTEDTGIAEGISATLNSELTSALSDADLLAQIAENADQYDEALVELALDEPTAIGFVAGYLNASTTGSEYGETVTQGTVPELYCWDTRWGYVTYDGQPLALNGSGFVSLSMAYMGLTGSSDVTAATLADAATEGEYASGVAGMSETFLEAEVTELGLSCSSMSEITADNITSALDSGAYLLVEVSAGTLTDEAHWVLVTGADSDGALIVMDPTSTSVTEHPWAVESIISSATMVYSLS